MFDPQEEARKELAKRELARRRLLPFVERFQPDYTAGWVHKDICKRLEQFSQDVADQLSPRLMIFVPPRHGKSQISSKSYPAWHLGHYPNHEFMLCSYSGALSMSFSRVVRSVMRDPAYHNVFDTQLDPDSQSVEAWLTTKGGGLVAAGVGGAITGKGAHVLLIDDPVKNREDADSEVSRQSTWDWYTSTAYTRLAPGGGVLVIQCMTGDTPVLRPTNTYTPLQDLRPGDAIASYDLATRTFVTSTVVNFAAQGEDDVFAITMSSGTIVKANERHPFLVQHDDGAQEWIRVRSLQSGHRIVTCPANGVNGEVKPAPTTTASYPPGAEGSAPHTTINGNGPQGTDPLLPPQPPREQLTSSTATGSRRRNILSYWKNRTAAALSAGYQKARSTLLGTGNSGCASTTATTRRRFADYCATTATSCSNAVTASRSSNPPSDTAAPTTTTTTDTIVSILPAGRAPVFDIEVAGTHNFIAINVIASNTRWHDDDLSGRLIEAQKAGADQWEIVDYPAVAEHDEPYRKRGEALHPERYDITRLTAIRKAIGERDWFALYQQKPISDEGSYFTKDMFPRYRPHERPPLQDLTIVASWDFAIGQKEVNDWTVCVVAGMDKDMRLWVLDCVRGKWDGYSIVQQIIAVQQRWKPERHGMEKGQILMSIEVFLRKEIEARQMYDLYYEPIAPGKNDKQARARGIQGLMKSGQVLFPDDDTTPWITQLVFECLRFPAGLHDDVVDALAYVGYLYRNMTPQPEPTTPKKPSWKDKLNQYVTYDSTRRRWQQA